MGLSEECPKCHKRYRWYRWYRWTLGRLAYFCGRCGEGLGRNRGAGVDEEGIACLHVVLPSAVAIATALGSTTWTPPASAQPLC